MIRAARVWAFLVGGALAYDVLALRTDAETLSAWCHDHRLVTVVLGAYLMAHLLGLPAGLGRFDPLHRLGEALAANRTGT